MNLELSQSDRDCRLADIAAYLDGELLPAEELEFEGHIAACSTCHDELNRQKQFLCILDCSLRSSDDVDLPRDFAKVVAANAESTVSGLRRRSEWLKAGFVCGGLLFVSLFALGADAAGSFGYPKSVFGQIYAVGAFVLHLAYDVAISCIVVIRSLSSFLIGGSLSVGALSVSLLLAAAAFSTMVMRRHYRA